MNVDQSVYPDVDHPPRILETIEEKADYVHRVCAAWDMLVLPTPETFDLFSTWRAVFDSHPIATSPGYHAFRASFGWPPVNYPPGISPPTPHYVRRDRLEGRGADPCEEMI